MAYIDHNHASTTGSYLHCPACLTPRLAKRGQDNRTGQEVWYLGCDCPAPNSLVTVMFLSDVARKSEIPT